MLALLIQTSKMLTRDTIDKKGKRFKEYLDYLERLQGDKSRILHRCHTTLNLTLS